MNHFSTFAFFMSNLIIHVWFFVSELHQWLIFQFFGKVCLILSSCFLSAPVLVFGILSKRNLVAKSASFSEVCGKRPSHFFVTKVMFPCYISDHFAFCWDNFVTFCLTTTNLYAIVKVKCQLGLMDAMYQHVLIRRPSSNFHFCIEILSNVWNSEKKNILLFWCTHFILTFIVACESNHTS